VDPVPDPLLLRKSGRARNRSYLKNVTLDNNLIKVNIYSFIEEKFVRLRILLE
jgi:hypothetical protein